MAESFIVGWLIACAVGWLTREKGFAAHQENRAPARATAGEVIEP